MAIRKQPIRKGVIAICSRGELGLVTSDSSQPVTYGDGKTGFAWTGIHLGQSKLGQPWSSRTPKYVGLMDTVLQRLLDDDNRY